jgi:hypothetical protein
MFKSLMLLFKSGCSEVLCECCEKTRIKLVAGVDVVGFHDLVPIDFVYDEVSLILSVVQSTDGRADRATQND